MNPLASTKCAGRLLMALAAITSILLMAACGSSSSIVPQNPQGFNDGSLTGNYVISISGTDVNSSSFIVPFAIAGTIAANGKGGITGGTVDINDPGNLGVQIGQAVNGSSSGYQVGQDGRGSGTLVVASGATFHFDFVLTSASHGLISRFDSFGTGSGTIDFQTPVTSLTGSYAFSLSGTDSGGNPLGTVGAFTLSSNSITGTEDFNDDLTSGPPGFTGLTLTGQVVLGAGGTSGTAQFKTLVAFSSLASLNFDVWVIDSTHLKFIENDTADSGVLLAGDAFTQVTSIAAGQLVFVLSGFDGFGHSVAAGGYATATDANGDLTNGFEDYNNDGVVGSLKPFFTTSATCVTATGRCQLALNGFSNGTPSPPSTFVVYPSSGGGLALEIDSAGLLQGASYSQSATAFTASGGYALNLTGQNTGPGGEVDDIAQFDAGAPDTSFSGQPINMTGSLDENDLGSLLTTTSSLKGIYVPDTAPDGRGSISSNNSGTLLGGFTLQYYVVDSSTVVFIDVDSFALDGSVAQVAVGTFQAQGASGSAAAQSRMAIVHPAVRAHGALRSK
jgi:hypothetical protein